MPAPSARYGGLGLRQNLCGQVEQLQQDVSGLGSDYAQFAGDCKRTADALVQLLMR